jgi:DNA-binding transcriptional ArsR family regulator
VATYGSSALIALGDPSRQAIIEQLADGPLAVSELAAQLPISRPAVSQHLKVLTEAGVVSHRAVGTKRVYYLDLAAITAIRVYLDGFWKHSLASFAEVAEDTDDTAPADEAPPPS